LADLLDVQTGAPVGSPLWWVAKLAVRIDSRIPLLQKYDDYYSGRQKLKFQSKRFQQAFGGLFADFSDNWCELVVEAVEERLNVTGFRFGTDGDDLAWQIWQANNLDADSQLGHTEALKSGMTYVLVSPGDPPQITIEDPKQVIVAYSAGNRRVRVAALKRWLEDDGHMMATLYLPEFVYKYRSERAMPDGFVSDSVAWVPREIPTEPWPVRNPLRTVPVVPLVNKPRLDGTGVSEIEGVIPKQDAVNKEIIDMLTASEFAAFKQRWIAGMDVEIDPVTKKPIAPFDIGVDRALIAPHSETRFGEFSESNLTNYVSAIEMLVQHIASQTRTPPHYFYLAGQFPSGESIKSAETGLVAKARRKMRHFGESWEEVMRLAFRAMGDPRAGVLDAETIWGDPESRSESEHIDAVVKKQALNVPTKQLWEDAGYSPQQIQRFEAMRTEDAFLQALQPTVPE
jgi:hypothetical protein